MGLKLESCLALFVVFCVVIFKLGRKRKGRGKDKIPAIQWTPFQIPFFDALIFFAKFRKQGVLMIDEVLKKYNESPVLKLNMGFKSMYLVGDMDFIPKLLKSSSPGHLYKPKVFYDVAFAGHMARGLVASPPDTWSPHRKALTTAFSYKSLVIYQNYIDGCVREMISEAHVTSTTPANHGCLTQLQMGKLLDFYGLKLMTLIVMGDECYSLSGEERSAFVENFTAVKEISVSRILNPILLLPIVWYFSPKRKFMESSLVFLHNFAQMIINRYRDKGVTKTKQMEDVSTLDNDDNLFEERSFSEIRGQETSKKSEILPSTEDHDGTKKPVLCLVEQLLKAGLPNEEIADEVGTFLVVGYETVRTALDMILFQLALHPEYQKKCQAEVDQLFDSRTSTDGTDPVDIFTLDDLTHLKYLEQCILESLRLTPTLPVYGRLLHEPLEVSPDWTLEKGETVFIFPWGVHRANRYYENPTTFDPDRFLAENIKKRHPHSFLPFSMGPRNCIGWKVAIMKMKMFLSWILRHYDLTTTDKPEDVKIFFEVTIRPERPYNVMYKRRENCDFVDSER